jgi:gliding motility-associated-like protein
VTTNIACHGAATGIIVVNAAGGTPAYTYAMDGSTYGTLNIFAGLTAGTHVANVKDANGCVYTDTITLTQPTAIHDDSVSMIKPLCNGASNGSITVYASGGVTPYTYALGTGAYGSSHTFTGLATGTYTLHVKDANGCIKDTTVSLLQPTVIVPSAAVTPSFCNTLANGRVVVSATGGTPAYSFAMGTGAYGPTGTFAPLAAGTYVFHTRDANGCIKDTTITIVDSMHVSGLFSITAALCYGQANGIIDVTGTGGTTPYVYGIGSGTYSTTHVFNALSAGSYMIHIKDANGCKDDTLIPVTQPAAILPAITVTDPLCHGAANGSVSVSVTGGTPSFTYSWNGGAFSPATTFSGLPAGTDSITIKDANGCLHDTAFTIQQPAPIVFAALTFTNISCYNGGDGTVTVTAAGATPPYMYATNGGPWQVSSAFTGLSAGIIVVQIRDNNGCELDTAITLTQPLQLVITGADTVNPTCEGYKNGSVTLHVTGGTLPYTYSDDAATFSSGNAFTGLPEGTYMFTIKDANGCTVDTAITLAGLPHILVENINLTLPLCYGSSDGVITLTAAGGVPPFVYKNDGNTAQDTSGIFRNLHAGPYTFTITDSRNCKKDTTVVLSQPDSLGITTDIVPNECKGTDDRGSVTANVTGGTPPYSYVWSSNPVQTTVSITGLPNGKYTVWVKDANNCSDSLASVVMYDNCCTPYIPNAFTPNGDGKNDDFRILFKGDMYIVTFSIYNRFGQQVYTISNTSDPNHGWDGKYKGVDAELGTYYYYAKIICGNRADHVVEFKGDITLVR